MLRVEYARWGQTPADLRRLAMSAPHPRTRERFLALYEITQESAPRALPSARPSPSNGDGVAASLQHRRPRGADLSAHRRPPPLCPEIEAGLGETVRAAQRSAAAPPIAGADPPPRWTLRRLVGWVHERFGRTCCRETIRAALHRLGLSWKKAKKLLGRADPQRRQAFVERIQDLWPVPSMTAIFWSTWTKPTSTRMPISATAGRSAAGASGLPRPRRVCRTSSRSMASTSVQRR